MVQQHGHRRPDPRDIFGRLSQLIASCIMLDSVRHEIRGGSFLSFEKQKHADDIQGPPIESFQNI